MLKDLRLPFTKIKTVTFSESFSGLNESVMSVKGFGPRPECFVCVCLELRYLL